MHLMLRTVMKRLLFLLVVVSAACLAEASISADWDFESAYNEKIAYIHVLENYSPHPLWQDAWGKYFFEKNGIRLNFGSIKSGTLLVDTQLNLNVELGKDFWFRLQSTWNDGEHRDIEKQDHLTCPVYIYADGAGSPSLCRYDSALGL